MSVIFKKLRKSKFYSEPIFPANLREGDLVFEKGKSFAITCILKPGEKKIDFFKEQKINKSMEEKISSIEENRTDYVVFLINGACNVFCRRYNPLLPIYINCFKDNQGIYNRQKGLGIWLLKFSIDYVSMKKVISNPSIYQGFIKNIDDTEIRDEVEVISSLMSLQYS